MKFTNTRNTQASVSASDAILNGTPNDGGLYVPSSLPILSGEDLSALCDLEREDRFAKILSLFVDELSYDELKDVVFRATDDIYNQLLKVEDGLYMLETWHGPSYIYNDFGSSLIANLSNAIRERVGMKTTSLSVQAVSRDMSLVNAYANIENIHALAIYPHDISLVAHRILDGIDADNIQLAEYDGDLKSLNCELQEALKDEEVKSAMKDANMRLQSRENLNIARVLATICELIDSYCDLVCDEEIELGDKINFAIPTADLTGALSAYYAYKMGLPIRKIIIATNANNALVDFFNEGVYDVNREFFRTMSQDLDKIFCENLERLIFEASGHDSRLLRELYSNLKACGKFVYEEITEERVFEAGWADEEDTKQAIYTFFDLDDYIMDTHTAVGASVYNDYSCDTDDETPTILMSLEDPYFNSIAVLEALGARERNEQKAIVKLQNLTALECSEDIFFDYEGVERETIKKGGIKKFLLNSVKRI